MEIKLELFVETDTSPNEKSTKESSELLVETNTSPNEESIKESSELFVETNTFPNEEPTKEPPELLVVTNTSLNEEPTKGSSELLVETNLSPNEEPTKESSELLVETNTSPNEEPTKESSELLVETNTSPNEEPTKESSELLVETNTSANEEPTKESSKWPVETNTSPNVEPTIKSSELFVETNTSLNEEPIKESEQLEFEATAKDGELVDESTTAKDGGNSSPLKDSSTDQVNEAPQNESTTVKDPSQYEPKAEKNPDSPAQNEPLIPYKPQAIKFNELFDQGHELKFAQTLQEVAPSCCRSIINNISTKTESVELLVPSSNMPQTTVKSSTPSMDTPPDSPMPLELEAQDNALPSIELVKEEEEEEQEEANNDSSATVIEHNTDEDAILSEPRGTSSPFYISSFEEDTELLGEETHGNVVPTMDLDNNDVYLNNNDEQNVPVSNMPRSTGIQLGSSSQHQANNPSSYPMSAPPGFGPRVEGAPSLSPVVDQNFPQPEPDFIHTNRNPQQTVDPNRCFPLGGTFHNFMQTEMMMPPRPPGLHHHQFMQLLNQAAGSAVRPHRHSMPHMGVNMARQAQFGRLVPNHLSANGAAPFHPPQVLMGSINGPLLQNHYRDGSSNSCRRANMEPVMGPNPIEGSSSGRGKRKFNWVNGADYDEVNSFPPLQVPITTHQDQQPINLFAPINGFRSDVPSIYDPLYEGLGLPIDPHIRLFLSSMESSKPWGPKPKQ